MDFDGDGRKDVISGSGTGETYLFRRLADGSFAAGEPVTDSEGKRINVGRPAAAFAADWDADGDLDLLIGNNDGEVYLVSNLGRPGGNAFGTPELFELGIPPKKLVCAAPVAADWDGDGKLDLILGTEAGGVYWFRNVGTPEKPHLADPEVLVDVSATWHSDDRIGAGEWGQRVKICATDWNADGRLDLLLGDLGKSFTVKPEQTEQEKVLERRAKEQLPDLRKKWSAAFRRYRDLLKGSSTDSPSTDECDDPKLKASLAEVKRWKDRIAKAEEIVGRYQPQRQSHGFVWLFLRKPAN